MQIKTGVDKHIGMNLTEGSLFKKIFIYALPIMLSGILQLLYNAADLIVCGQFGSEHSVGAISSTNALTNLIINLFLGLSVGANVLMARCYGAKDKEKGQRVVYTSMVFSLIFGIIVGIFGYFTTGFFLELMGTDAEIIDLSAEYLKIYFMGLPFSMIYNFGASIFRATGNTRHPFYFLAISGIFNVVLNLVFVISFKMDVPGVAWATIISQAISAILIIIALCRSHGFFEFKFKNIRVYKKEAIEIAVIGLPAGLQGCIFSLSNVLIQSSVNLLGVELGTSLVDGNGASSSLEGFIYTSMNAFAQTAAAFVSANYGAGKIDNIKKSVLYSSLWVIIISISMGIIMFIFQKQLLGFYVKTEDAIKYGVERFSLFAFTYFTCGLMDTFAQSIRGIGRSLLPTIVSLAGACGLRILWIYCIFPIDYFHSLFWLSASYPISWVITFLVHIVVFFILFRTLQNKFNDNTECQVE